MIDQTSAFYYSGLIFGKILAQDIDQQKEIGNKQNNAPKNCQPHPPAPSTKQWSVP